MNKIVKLPLFLGICGAACAGILAGVYAFTNPIITSNAEKAANAAIYEAFSSYGDENSLKVSNVDLTDDIKAVGVTSKKEVTSNTLSDGMVYTCTTNMKGYAGVISFQVAFAQGKFLSYTDLGNSETKSLISKMNEKVAGVSASGYSFEIMSGETFTSKALKSALDVIAADYAK